MARMQDFTSIRQWHYGPPAMGRVQLPVEESDLMIMHCWGRVDNPAVSSIFSVGRASTAFGVGPVIANQGAYCQ